jgi:hypothetical protein
MSNRFLSAALAAACAFSAFCSDAQAQTNPYAEPLPFCPDIVRAYVDPATGCDPLNMFGLFDPSAPEALARLNDPTAPFQTIQAGIDTCLEGVKLLFHPFDRPDAQGIVFCMPGTYGPTAAQARRDVFPLMIRDRVSLQGMGARRTVLRGGGPTNTVINWPNDTCCGNPLDKEVILDFSNESHLAGGLPWVDFGNTEEMVDAFSFEFGDVQVFWAGEVEGFGRLSNCVLDLRADEDAAIGPEVGVMMVHTYDQEVEGGYDDFEMKVFNNTFIFGEVTAQSDLALRPPRSALSWAVGILDVNNPLCDYEYPPDLCDNRNIALDYGDDNIHLRGVGNPSIQNNLFRTLPGEPMRQIMLGIDRPATRIKVNGGTVAGDTNAFVSNHIGGDISFDTSGAVPVPMLYSTHSLGTPTPKVDLVTASNDPAFIGELVAPVLLSSPNNLKVYRDWRLTPSSSNPLDRRNVLQDKGSSPNLPNHPTAPYVFIAENDTAYAEPFCSEFWSFDWDGEGFGNRRRVREVDIGFDEVHLTLSAGTWANDSASHHNPDLVIDPNTTTISGARRFMVFPSFAAASGNTLTVHSTNQAYLYGGSIPPCGPSIVAWEWPHGTIGPIGYGDLAVGYQWQYIPFTDPDGLTPWNAAVSPLNLTNPANSLVYPVGVYVRVDQEGTGPATYFNPQCAVTVGGLTYYGNLQAEYR